MSDVKRRYSKQSQQEDRCRGQFKDRLGEIGWPNNLLTERDLGEDALVNIYDDGVSTGLSFQVQLKSAADASRYALVTAPDFIAYDLKVADLVHWEHQTTVVIVVWDIQERTGWWQLVPTIVRDLDRSGAEWRDGEWTSVHISRQNATDDAGLERLRRALAKHVWPLFADKVGAARCTFSFPATPEGRTAGAALQRFIDDGEPVKIDGRYIETYEPPKLLRKLFGQMPKPVSIEMRPVPSHTAISLRIEVTTSSGTVVGPQISIRRSKAGEKRTTLSNVGDGALLAFEIVIDDERRSVTMNWRADRDPATPTEAIERARFLLALAGGSRIQIVRTDDRQTWCDVEMPPVTTSYKAEELLSDIRLFEAIAFIQTRCAHLGRLRMPDSLTGPQVAHIFFIEEVLRYGRIKRTLELTLDSKTKCIDDSVSRGNSGPLLTCEGARAHVLGVEIPLGQIQVFAKDRADAEARLCAAVREVGRTGREVVVRDLEVEDVFDLRSVGLAGAEVPRPS